MKVRIRKPFKIVPPPMTLVYEDENGKPWKFGPTYNPRRLVREDGWSFSHTHVYLNYEFKKQIKKEILQ